MRSLRVFFAIALLLPVTQATAQTCPSGIPRVAPDSRYTVSQPVAGQRVVQDLRTGLMWKQCLQGLSGVGCASGTDLTLSWTAALGAAASESFAGFNDWRLPSASELLSLVETGCHSPAINANVFPSTRNTLFWASTTDTVTGNSRAWGVGFFTGSLSNTEKTIAVRFRLVRGGQLDAFDSGLDFTPDPFSFTPQVGVPQNSPRTSSAITLSALAIRTGIQVVGASGSQYRVNGGAWTQSPGTVVNGDSVELRHTSAATAATSVTSTLRVGGVSADFVSTTIGPALTTTTITSDQPDPSRVGESYTVMVNVVSQTLSPTGMVSVSDGQASCGPVALVPGTPPASSASCMLASSSAGSKTLTANFMPDTAAFAASSDTEAHGVIASNTTLSVSGPLRSRINTATSFNIALAPVAPGMGTPSGTVTLSSGSSCQISLPATSCMLSFSSLGSRVVSASYAGDGNFNASVSSGTGNATTLVFASSDLQVTKSNGESTYVPGALRVYTIQLRNLGPDVAANVRLLDLPPASLSGVVWSCIASAGASCPQPAGSVSIDQTVATLPVAGLLTYTLSGNVVGSPPEISNTASVSVPTDTTVEDPNTNNNSSTDTDRLDAVFANGYESPAVNAPSGVFLLPGNALRGVIDAVAVAVYQLTDHSGTALQVFARVLAGELEYALAVRDGSGRLRLGSWQPGAGEPTLRWTAVPSGDGWVIERALLTR